MRKRKWTWKIHFRYRRVKAAPDLPRPWMVWNYYATRKSQRECLKILKHKAMTVLKYLEFRIPKKRKRRK